MPAFPSITEHTLAGAAAGVEGAPACHAVAVALVALVHFVLGQRQAHTALQFRRHHLNDWSTACFDRFLQLRLQPRGYSRTERHVYSCNAPTKLSLAEKAGLTGGVVSPAERTEMRVGHREAGPRDRVGRGVIDRGWWWSTFHFDQVSILW